MSGEVDAEAVSLFLGRGSLFGQPQVQDVERAWSEADGPDPSLFVRDGEACRREGVEVLHE